MARIVIPITDDNALMSAALRKEFKAHLAGYLVEMLCEKEKADDSAKLNKYLKELAAFVLRRNYSPLSKELRLCIDFLKRQRKVELKGGMVVGGPGSRAKY